MDARGTEEWTPLHLASVSGSAHVVSVLLRSGADVNAISDRGDTPLHLVVTSGCLEAARSLVKAGANIGALNQKGLSPLGKADLNGETILSTYFRQRLKRA